jgi:hypothetical protein
MSPFPWSLPMKKREFLSAAALASVALPGASQAQAAGKTMRVTPCLLTLGGADGRRATAARWIRRWTSLW